MATTDAPDMLQEDQYDDTPQGLARLWKTELDAAKKWLADFHEDGEKIERRYRDERDGKSKHLKRLNIYPANVQTQEALMYGKTPGVDVSRKFNDAHDEKARLAGMIGDRALNNDIKRPIDTYARALGRALKDRRLPGLGQCCVYYSPSFKKNPAQPAKLGDDGKELAPAVAEYDAIDKQEVEVHYVYWRDQLWSPCRVQEEMRWWSKLARMGQKECVARFGEDIGRRIPLKGKKDKEGDPAKDDPWQRADVWEIWSKERNRRYWWAEGMDIILDEKPGLELEGFWPFGDPMAANLHNGTTIPKSDFHLAMDCYNNVDLFTTRIHALARGVKIGAGADSAIAGKLKELLDSDDGDVIDIENWNLHSSKGGFKGRIDWLPLDMIVMALDKLREMRTEEIALAYQISGMSDLSRGQQTENGTPGEARVKEKFANVRTQSLQEEFAHFASELQRVKFEVMCRHFTDETWILKSNILNTPEGQDVAKVKEAIAFLRSNYWQYSVEVTADSLASDDYSAKQAEASEAIAALSSFLSAAAPLAQNLPTAMPFLLELLQAAMANYRWFNDKAEGIFDAAVEQAKAAAAQPKPGAPPDPKLQAAQLKLVSDQNKGRQDMEREQFKLQANLATMQEETRQKQMQEQNQRVENVQEAQAKQMISATMRAQRPEGGKP